MSTERNKAVVRAFVEVVNQQNWQCFDELVALNFTGHSTTCGQPTICSRDQLSEFLAAEAGTFPDA